MASGCCIVSTPTDGVVEQIENGVTDIVYELEVEFKNLKSDISDKYRAHSGLLLIRDLINMCEKIDPGCELKMNV